MRRFSVGLALFLFVIPGPSAALAESAPLPPLRPAAEEPRRSATGAPAEPPAVPLPVPVFAKGRGLYLPLAVAEAERHDLPSAVADAVMRVESNYEPGAIGGVGERGLMQVLPSTAAMLGFRGTMDELADPETNIRLGVRYLAGAWKLTGGDLCRTLMKYRAGHKEQRMSALSVEYCRRAKAHLALLGSPLAAGPLPAAEFGAAPLRVAAGPVARRGGRRLVGRAFWAAHTARIKALEARLPWKRGGIMAGG